jgi:hypothetical protein
VHEVACIVSERNLDFGEVLVQDIGPIGLQDRIVAPPKNARWHGYLRRPLRRAGHHGQAADVLTDVPVEAALHIARPHEVVDPSIENGVESIFPVRPVAQEMAMCARQLSREEVTNAAA